jgi:hypothetical protein
VGAVTAESPRFENVLQANLADRSPSAVKPQYGAADTCSVAQQEVGDVWALIDALDWLTHRERELSDVRKRLHDRIDAGYKTELTAARERQISDERRELHRQIDGLRAQLAPLVPREAQLSLDDRRWLHDLGL